MLNCSFFILNVSLKKLLKLTSFTTLAKIPSNLMGLGWSLDSLKP